MPTPLEQEQRHASPAAESLAGTPSVTEDR